MFTLWKSLLPATLLSLFLIGIFVNQTPPMLTDWGLHPRDMSYLFSAFTYPFIHGDPMHISGNIISFLGLSFLFVLIFPRDWWRFFFLQWILSSLLLFFFAQPGKIHIGASAWLFAFASFMIVFTLKMKLRRLKSLFLIIVVWYGSMWWGLLPLIPHVSYEGHIAGMVSGLTIALFGFSYWKKRLGSDWYISPKDWENESSPENPYDNL
jgi:membrane associated rhomboid family serine protease